MNLLQRRRCGRQSLIDSHLFYFPYRLDSQIMDTPNVEYKNVLVIVYWSCVCPSNHWFFLGTNMSDFNDPPSNENLAHALFMQSANYNMLVGYFLTKLQLYMRRNIYCCQQLTVECSLVCTWNKVKLLLLYQI